MPTNRLAGDITRPHLWPSADLRDAQAILRERADHPATRADHRASAVALLDQIADLLATRKAAPRC